MIKRRTWTGLRRLTLAVGAAALLAGPPALRAETRGGTEILVDLELVLAIDVSGSVDFEEGRLQRDGYVAALRADEVLRAIQSGPHRKIAITYIEWAGSFLQSKVVEWALIEDRASARDFADRLAGAPIDSGPWTSISGAIDFAVPLFAANNYRGTRRVIDVSGDGPNNSGRLVTEARSEAAAKRVTINGIAILNDRPQPSGRRQIADLDKYYASCVIAGAGAFLVIAHDFKDFARAIRRKMVFEIAGLRPPDSPLPAPSRRPGPHLAAATYAPGCDIGERRLRERLRYLEDY